MERQLIRFIMHLTQIMESLLFSWPGTSSCFPQGEISRLSTKKEVVMKGNINNYFKLGQEGKYRVYHNQYSTNSFALNKHQHRRP